MDVPAGISVIVPAHDEASVLGHCLASLAAQDLGAPVQVVVVPNGCGDDTATVARSYAAVLAARGFELRVVEIDAASKPAALNAGDRVARYGHRCYLDADVTLSPNALASVTRAFAADSRLQFCSPQMRAEATTYTSRMYARVWGELPYVKSEVIGAGCYAVRAEGRRRWDTFPEIVADDKFARLHFKRGERRVLDDARFVVHLPVGVVELVRVRSRWIRANRELRSQFPALARTDKRRFGGSPRFIMRNPALWKDLVPFSAVYLAAELRAVLAGRRERAPWERATGAREARAVKSTT